LNKAATAKNQEPWLDAQMRQGTHHARKSNIAVLLLRPILSTIAPDKNAKIICENI